MSTEVDPEKNHLLNEDGDNPGDDEAGKQFEMEYKNTDKSRIDSVDPTSSNKKRKLHLVEKQVRLKKNIWKKKKILKPLGK